MMSNSTVSPPAPETLKPLLDLFELLNNPGATKERLAEFVEASEQARLLIAEAKAAQAELLESRQEHETSFVKMVAEKEKEFEQRETALTLLASNLEKQAASQDEKTAKREEVVNRREAALAARER